MTPEGQPDQGAWNYPAEVVGFDRVVEGPHFRLFHRRGAPVYRDAEGSGAGTRERNGAAARASSSPPATISQPAARPETTPALIGLGAADDF